MKRIVAGILIFCCGALIAFLFMTQQQVDEGSENARRVDVPEVQHLADPMRSNSSSVREVEERSSSGADTEDGGAPIESSVRSTERDTNTIVADAGPAVRRPEGSVPAEPVPVLEGIELRGNMRMLHDLLAQEATDHSWAQPLEADLYEYFLSHSQELANNFGLPNVVCRRTLCEIQVIGHGQDALRVWEEAISEMDAEPWAEEIVEMQLGGNPIGPNSTGLVLIIKKGDAGSLTQVAGDPGSAI